jgi:hypothetical protein
MGTPAPRWTTGAGDSGAVMRSTSARVVSSVTSSGALPWTVDTATTFASVLLSRSHTAKQSSTSVRGVAPQAASVSIHRRFGSSACRGADSRSGDTGRRPVRHSGTGKANVATTDATTKRRPRRIERRIVSPSAHSASVPIGNRSADSSAVVLPDARPCTEQLLRRIHDRNVDDQPVTRTEDAATPLVVTATWFVPPFLRPGPSTASLEK